MFINSIKNPIETFSTFQSVIIKDEYIEKGEKRLLDVDNSLILPINQSIRFLITSLDVLHA